MENKPTTVDFIEKLSESNRVITLGGVAVIAHGLDRNTLDADIWLDPVGSGNEWVENVCKVMDNFPSVIPIRIAHWTSIEKEFFADLIEVDGVCRLNGMERPLDIFRKPNEIELDSFDEIWNRAKPMKDGTRLPDVIDLLLTKQLTGRAKDNYDISFLEGKATATYLEKLSFSSAEEALEMLERFMNPEVAAAALKHPASKVREAGLSYLRELAEAGDPFAVDLLRENS